MGPFQNGIEHLLAELAWLDLLLERQVLRLRAANVMTLDEMRGLYIPDALADALLRQMNQDTSASSAATEEGYSLRELSDQITRRRGELDERVAVSQAVGVDLPLPRLARLFALTPFEQNVLVIGLGTDVDLRYETLYAYAQNDVAKKRATVDLTLRLLCTSLPDQLKHHSLFASDSALLRHHLVKLVQDPQDREPPLLAHFIQVEPRVVHFILGEDKLESQLLAFTRSDSSPARLDTLPLAPAIAAQLDRVLSTWNHSESTAAIVQHVFVQVTSHDNNTAHGKVYCSESLATNETDNTILLTVVVLGRSAT